MGDRPLDDEISVEEIRQYAKDYRTHFETPENKLFIGALDKVQFNGDNCLEFYKGLIAGFSFHRGIESYVQSAADIVVQPLMDLTRGYYANKIEKLGLLGELEKSIQE